VIADECHHLTAFSFEQVMRHVKAKFIVGLTATPPRKDGHHRSFSCSADRYGST
jgi:superfamily II DNA or RNA helicase